MLIEWIRFCSFFQITELEESMKTLEEETRDLQSQDEQVQLLHMSGVSFWMLDISIPPLCSVLCLSVACDSVASSTLSRHKPLWKFTVWAATGLTGTWKRLERRTRCCRRATLRWDDGCAGQCRGCLAVCMATIEAELLATHRRS